MANLSYRRPPRLSVDVWVDRESAKMSTWIIFSLLFRLWWLRLMLPYAHLGMMQSIFLFFIDFRRRSLRLDYRRSPKYAADSTYILIDCMTMAIYGCVVFVVIEFRQYQRFWESKKSPKSRNQFKEKIKRMPIDFSFSCCTSSNLITVQFVRRQFGSLHWFTTLKTLTTDDCLPFFCLLVALPIALYSCRRHRREEASNWIYSHHQTPHRIVCVWVEF